MKSVVLSTIIAAVLYLIPLSIKELKVENQNYDHELVEIKHPSYEDVYLLARLLKSEAYANNMADSIAKVVINRIYDEDHPSTLEGVIYQGAGTNKVQFDGINTKNFHLAPEDYYIKVARNILYLHVNNVYQPDDILFYYTTSATDQNFINSMKGKEVYIIQNTTFCRK